MSVYKVRKEKQVPIPVIVLDYHRVKKDINTKVSAMTLRYLNRTGIAKFPFYTYYKEAAERPGDRTTDLEKNVIVHINGKFIKYYERMWSLSMSFLTV